ncbi:hypothetical protein [Thiorhodococcus minor]|uniref:Porin n=1 Tax=Thiorhodococcus minor TaxID=57489 RepID=A0A6M0JXE1_9GAMM|nr:hypothetical protein [Thiorhodococcus minor]NEV61641.1 hypothetical protein [Thiorhodococcus minor]
MCWIVNSQPLGSSVGGPARESKPRGRPGVSHAVVRGRRIFCVIAALLILGGRSSAADLSVGDGVSGDLDRRWYDQGQAYVANQLYAAAVWLDSFFGDPRAEAADGTDAYLHVIFDGFYSGVEDESENGIKFRGGANLERLNERLRLVVTSDADAAVTGRELAGTARDEVRDTDGAVGLSYLFRDRPGQKFSLGGGVSGGLSPSFLLAGRHRYAKSWTSRTASHVTSTLYWKSDDGPGVSSLVDYEWISDPDTLWRYTVFGNFREETGGVDWSTQAKWARRLDDKTAVNIRAGVQGNTEPSNVLTEGWLKVLYRRNFLRSWLFYEVEPGLSWHERVQYRTEPTIALRLEIQFRRD